MDSIEGKGNTSSQYENDVGPESTAGIGIVQVMVASLPCFRNSSRP